MVRAPSLVLESRLQQSSLRPPRNDRWGAASAGRRDRQRHHAGGLSADDAPMHSRQTAMNCSERSESAKAATVARTSCGSHTRAPSSSVVTAAVTASKEVNAPTELRLMTGGWLRVMGRGGWI